ncbi:MAG: biopolymer transporter ExbD [Gammaproteobacteria bacterium]|nr:biopolymer transporter ExbD [Gammaproteobacteria bacterium]MDH5727485.1 biopolymer transporter ExbD [Gammaproteobacteria bacterium]
MRRRFRRRRVHHHADLDITAFMNLMVILVPFLLITAVFSRITVLDLFLPPQEQSSTQAASKQFQLLISVRENTLLVREARSGLRQTLKADSLQARLKQLEPLLIELKRRYPEKRAVTLLAESNIEYDMLVQTMDLVRMVKSGDDYIELFPDISIGDAATKAKR